MKTFCLALAALAPSLAGAATIERPASAGRQGPLFSFSSSLNAPAPALTPSLSLAPTLAPALAPGALAPAELVPGKLEPAALEPAALMPAAPSAAIAGRPGPGAPPPAGAPASADDITAEFRAIWDGAPGLSLRAGDPPELLELRKYKVLLVPGFMTGVYVRLGNPTSWPARRYFGDQLDWLKREGIEHEVVDVHSLQSVEHNAPIVAAAIERSDKPVLVVSHSMGGRILLHALITSPRLRARVRGWTPMQTPFLGSHIADLPAIVGVSGLLRLFGGTKEAVRSMTGRRSRAYNELHSEAIAEILRVVPVVAFASWVNTAAPSWLALANPPLKWAWDAISRRGGKNDILIPVKNAALPGMPLVVVHGVDHASAVVDTSAPVERVRILKTLLTMVLRRSALAGVP